MKRRLDAEDLERLRSIRYFDTDELPERTSQLHPQDADKLDRLLDAFEARGDAEQIIRGLVAAGETRVFWDKAVADAEAWLNEPAPDQASEQARPAEPLSLSDVKWEEASKRLEQEREAAVQKRLVKPAPTPTDPQQARCDGDCIGWGCPVHDPAPDDL